MGLTYIGYWWTRLCLWLKLIEQDDTPFVDVLESEPSKSCGKYDYNKYSE